MFILFFADFVCVMNALRPENFYKNYVFSLAQNMPILALSGTFLTRKRTYCMFKIFNDFYF